MTRPPQTGIQWRNSLPGTILAVLAGLLLWASPLGDSLENSSYDLLFLIRPSVNLEEIVIVYMDEKSFRELKQEPRNWDRRLHAALLDQLTKDQAKLAVFDVWLTDPGSPESNAELVRAMKANGWVVVAGLLDSRVSPGLSQGILRPPRKEFLDTAAAWGIAGVQEEQGTVVRRHFPNTELARSLPWEAARLAGVPATREPANASAERWLNYYGPHGTIPNVSYCDVNKQAPGFFRGKTVFIGGHPKALYAFEEAEGFPIPFTRWGAGLSPGVDIMATAYLNLYRGDWLRRYFWGVEFGFILFTGLVFGHGLSLVRPIWGLAMALGGSVVLVLIAGALFLVQDTWFPWLIMIGVQIPVAWVCSMVVQAGFRSRAEHGKATKADKPASPATLEGDIPIVPDHTLIRAIGGGSYGEVWLARNVIGSFHAVKVVHRRRFQSKEPFEREFEGLKKFTPISRAHESFVDILHVGINHEAGYFYYVMELADDEKSATWTDPASYSPKTLESVLNKYRKLPVEQCVSLGLSLASGLSFLHGRSLIHRDLKPSNIIIVQGKPKLADIGLVTEIAKDGQKTGSFGTLAYMAPEGPGTPAADVYSLGKLLYQACMGRSPSQYPCPRSTLLEGEADPVLLQLNDVILKTCEADVRRRYQSAAELKADLLQMKRALATATPSL